MEQVDSEISDHFKIGDKVEWITVRQRGKIVDIRKFNGTIDEIQGSTAMIKSIAFKRRKRVSLFDLEVIE